MRITTQRSATTPRKALVNKASTLRAGSIGELSRWTHATLEAFALLPTMLAVRGSSLVHGAMWLAVTAVEVEEREAAMAAAAHEALVTLISPSRPEIARAWAQSSEAIGRAEVAGPAIAAGRAAAARYLARHEAGGESSTPDSGWLASRPILLDDPDWLIRDQGPGPESKPGVGEIREVLEKGGREAPSRTADQAVAAIYWCAYPQVVRRAAVLSALGMAGPDLLEDVRVLACVAAAVADSQVAAWRLKSRSASPRPRLVIHGAAPSRLWPRTHQAAWEPLVECAEDAERPSEWCVALGAGIGALRAIAGKDDVDVSVTCPRIGVTRHFASLSEMLQESEDARIWAGLHFRSTAVESTEMGLRLGQHMATLAAAA
jgi:hypothetical protein